MSNALPLVRIAFVTLLISMAGLITAFTLRAQQSGMPLVYLPEVQITVTK
jgi:hypothetical protein